MGVLGLMAGLRLVWSADAFPTFLAHTLPMTIEEECPLPSTNASD